MHFVWEFNLTGDSLLTTGDGRRVSVVDPGRHNFDAGPDFFNAKVMIGDHLWAGDVEIHTRASDWYRHHHETDPAYSSVILHVIAIEDGEARRADGTLIPQAVLCCNNNFRRDYNSLLSTTSGYLPCSRQLPSIHSLHITSWMSTLGIERLSEKSGRILEIVQQSNGDWQQAAYVTTARALGFGLNSEPMGRLALGMPLQVLHKHADSQETLEALLLGQAGFLMGAEGDDPYVDFVEREYGFYRVKYALSPIENAGWKMSRTRPGNNPQRRVAILAALVAGNFNLVTEILDAGDDIESIRGLFDVKLSPFWATHYSLEHRPEAGADGSVPQLSGLGRQSIDTLIINVVAPLLAAYGTAHNDASGQDRAVSFLEKIPAENNRITKVFTNAGLPCPDAFTSQAMIRLNSAYCSSRNCISCRLGHRILSKAATLSTTIVRPI